jgi:hypothetical protein
MLVKVNLKAGLTSISMTLMNIVGAGAREHHREHEDSPGAPAEVHHLPMYEQRVPQTVMPHQANLPRAKKR